MSTVFDANIDHCTSTGSRPGRSFADVEYGVLKRIGFVLHAMKPGDTLMVELCAGLPPCDESSVAT